MSYELIKINSEADWASYHKIRREILWEARGLNDYDDKHKDEFILSNHPLLLKLNGRAIGTTRLDDFRNGSAAVRLVAIVKDIQRQGHGRKLSAMVEGYAHHLGIGSLLVNAAPEAVGYYEKLGWMYFTWDQNELAGIAADCKQMKKILVSEET